jgi:hypothetical protein
VDNNAGDGGPTLDWSNAQPVSDISDGTAEVSCEAGGVLRDVICFSNTPGGAGDPTQDNIRRCDTRMEASASSSAGYSPGVSGTCVPLKGVKKQVFSNQDSSNTFQVPSGASRVEYKVYGGVGGGVDFGDEVDPGGAGGYVEGSIPLEGGETLNIYVGQDGGTGQYVGPPSEGGPSPIDSGGSGGCVPFNGGECGGDGGDGYRPGSVFGEMGAVSGSGGGGAPSIVTDSSNQIMVAAGGGGGRSSGSGGGGGAGGGKGEDVSEGESGEDADNTPQNLGGDAASFDPGSGGTFVDGDLPTPDSEGTSREGARVELAAIP